MMINGSWLTDWQTFWLKYWQSNYPMYQAQADWLTGRLTDFRADRRMEPVWLMEQLSYWWPMNWLIVWLTDKVIQQLIDWQTSWLSDQLINW